MVRSSVKMSSDPNGNNKIEAGPGSLNREVWVRDTHLGMLSLMPREDNQRYIIGSHIKRTQGQTRVEEDIRSMHN